MGKDDDQIHVVMVPWLGFGHMIPFHHLSIALARKGVRVSFLSTPRNIQRLAKIPTELAPLINMVELQLPVDRTTLRLPDGAEAGVDIPNDKRSALVEAYNLLKDQFKQFLMQQSQLSQLPDWIVVDVVSHWAAEVAKEFGIKVILFSVLTAAVLTFFGSFDDLREGREARSRLLPDSIMTSPEWVDFSPAVAFRRHEAVAAEPLFKAGNGKGTSFSERSAKVNDACHAIAIRSCHEVESDYLGLLGNVAGRPVFPVGLLLPERKSETEIHNENPKWDKMFKWLDEQPPRSVVFVGFGSECKLAEKEVHEIAYGLEISKLPFFWILQNPDWVEDEDGDGPLPAGFRSRTAGQGVAKFGWAPQNEILAHPSIACSLFHSGWGSAIETLQHGHSLVVLPFIYDQSLNARLLVNEGLAIEVDREEDGSFSRDDVAKCLRLAMVSEKGEELRNRAANVFRDPQLHVHNDRYLDQLVEFLQNS